MRRRTSAPSRNSAMPSWYLPLSRSCSSNPSDTSVTASRWTVLLARPSRRASALMPISTSSSENALSRRMAVATDDRRRRRPCGSVLPAGFFLAIATSAKLLGAAFRSADRCSEASRRSRPDVSIIAPHTECGTGSWRMNAARKIVVVGGGPAGVAAALAAKQQDAAVEVVLLNDEQHEPYEKPPLSKAVLTGKVMPADAPIAGPKGVAGAGVALRSGTRAAAIDRGARAIVTEAGERLGYGALVPATRPGHRVRARFPPGPTG